jgi:hypothetical protein
MRVIYVVKEFQLKEGSRYKNIEKESVEVKTSSIDQRSRESGEKTGCRRMKSKCSLSVI